MFVALLHLNNIALFGFQPTLPPTLPHQLTFQMPEKNEQLILQVPPNAKGTGRTVALSVSQERHFRAQPLEPLGLTLEGATQSSMPVRPRRSPFFVGVLNGHQMEKNTHTHLFKWKKTGKHTYNCFGLLALRHWRCPMLLYP